MSKPVTAPIGGMRDFLPLDVLRRAYVVETIERIYRAHGFEPLQTPAMERLSTLLGKYGEEGDQLVFRVLKRGHQLEQALGNGAGESDLSEEGLRYDLTVPLARVIAEHRNELPAIFKRYQIQPVWRADRPAKGRFREFYQCDVDVVGTRSTVAEVEVLSAATQVLLELGFGPDFAIRLNHRGILQGMMEVAGVPTDLRSSAIVAIDKLDKIGAEQVRAELQERGLESSAAGRLMDMLHSAPGDNAARIEWLSTAVGSSETGAAGVSDLRSILEYARGTAAAPHLRIDPFLARGLSYYTGAIVEIAAPDLAGSLGGGGRYDNLLGMFSGRDIPAVGLSLGLERLLVVMEDRDMFPDHLAGRPQVLVTQSDPAAVADTLQLAAELRQAGLLVDVYPDIKGYGTQFKYADKRGIRYALLAGERESAGGVVAIKDLVSGDQSEVPRSEIAAALNARLAGS